MTTQRISRQGIAPACALVLLAAVAFASIACGGSSPSGGVVVRPAAEAPRAPSTPPAAVAPAPAAPTAATPPATPVATRTPAPTPAAAAAAPSTVLSANVKPPTAGQWIEVDVTRFVVRLMEGERVVREIAPVGVGREIDTGIYESTQTGLFKVHNKIAPRTFDAPYNTYIEWWVGFDTEKDNGFHSFLQDKDGKVVDASTGRVSNGCIRTGEGEALFKYAEAGMPVLVHA